MKTLLALLGGVSATLAPAGVILKEEISKNLATKAAAVQLQMPDMSEQRARRLSLWEKAFDEEPGIESPGETYAYSHDDYGFQLARDVKQQTTEEGQDPVRDLTTVQSYNLINKDSGDSVYQIQSKGNNIVKMHTLDDGSMVFDDIPDTNYFAYDKKGSTSDKDYLRTSVVQFLNNNGSYVSRYVAGWSGEVNGTGSVKLFDGYTESFLDLDFVVPESINVEGKDVQFSRFLNVFSNTKADGSITLYIAAYFETGSDYALGVFDFDLTDKIDSDLGEFDPAFSGEIPVTNAVWTEKLGTKFNSVGDFIFFADPQGYASFLHAGDAAVGIRMYTENTNNDESIKPFGKVIEIDEAEALSSNSKITSVITTQHRLTNKNYQDYVVFTATDTQSKDAKLWYLDYNSSNPFKVGSKELFNLNLYQTDNSDLTVQNEGQKVTNLISYYDNVANEFKISLTTNRAVYSYIYKTPSDFGSSINSRAIKELFIETGYTLNFKGDNQPMFNILSGSLNYINGEIVFLLGADSDNETLNAKTWYGSLYEKYDISNISLNSQITEFTPSSNENDVQTNVQELKDEIIDEFKSINGTVGTMFKQASSYEEAQVSEGQEHLWDYKVDVTDELADQFFPTNQFGNINEQEKVKILTNNTEDGQWAAKFQGQTDRTVSISYTNAYDLVDLVEHMNSLYATQTIVADDFNHIVGQIYNDIGDHLNEAIRLKNQEVPLFSKNEKYWEINNWAGSEGTSVTSFDRNNWGFFNGDNKVDENGYYSKELTNINIKIGKEPEKQYFTVSESENTFTDERGNVYIKLEPITVKYKSELISYTDSKTNPELKLDISAAAKEATKLQFDGRGFDVNSSREALEYMLNQNRKLGHGIGYAISQEQYDAATLSKGTTTLKVYIYDKAFPNPADGLGGNDFAQPNYEIVEVLILGLTEASALPTWIMPTLVLGGMTLLIMTIMTVWFISRKRFYKKAIGKEGAKIAIARMKEQKLKEKVGDK